jgi:hypothetical protein
MRSQQMVKDGAVTREDADAFLSEVAVRFKKPDMVLAYLRQGERAVGRRTREGRRGPSGRG